jgi:hypothetical protein
LTGPLFWIIFIVAAVPLLSATADRSAMAGRTRVRALLERGGGGSLGYMATWPGNVYWFSEHGDAAVAYRVINGIAITMSDPICRPERDEQTVREFVAFCDAESLTPVFYSVHEQFLPIFDSMGWQHTSVGEETVVRTQGLELTGKAWQKVRQPLNRALKEGLTTVWTTWDELPLTTAAEIRAISEEWVSEKELPEMGFTLGGLDELKDRNVRLMLAIGPDGRLQAVTSWLPTFRDGQPIGWTIDFMRRAEPSMPGVMEFVIASAALHMKETGAEFLSLSGAPLATKPLAAGETPPPPTPMTRLLDWLAKTLEPAYGFSSLFRFKAKFNPEYRTISMAYADPLALPGDRAGHRAGIPSRDLAQGGRRPGAHAHRGVVAERMPRAGGTRHPGRCDRACDRACDRRGGPHRLSGCRSCPTCSSPRSRSCATGACSWSPRGAGTCTTCPAARSTPARRPRRPPPARPPRRSPSTSTPPHSRSSSRSSCRRTASPTGGSCA